MLNKNAMQAVSQLRDISDSIIFNYPITGVKNSGGTIVSFIDLESLGVPEFEEFGVIKFKELVDLINVAGADAEISLKNGVINITGKNISLRYFTTDVSVLEENFRTSFKMLEKTAQAEAALEFNISAAELAQIKKVSSLLNVEDLIISVKDNSVVLGTENSSQKSSNGGVIRMNNSVINKDDTNVILGMSNFKKLPDGDYKVKVAINGSAYITRFDSLTIDGLVVNIATKAC